MRKNVQQLNAMNAPAGLGPLTATVSYGLKRAHLRMIRDLEAALAPEGFTPPLLAALSIVVTNPGIAPARLAEAMGHGRSRAAPLLDRLEETGLLAREAGADRRSLQLHATPAGRAMLARLEELLAAHERRITAAFSSEEAKQLVTLLEKVARED
jgi:DNA-binding MarR family transcriptional regulator